MPQRKGSNCPLEARKLQATNSRRNWRRINNDWQYLRNSWYLFPHVTEISDACWILKNEKGSSSVMHNGTMLDILTAGPQ